MILLLRTRWPLLLALIVFITCKIQHLFFPYYWDESWPYMPAVRAMYDHGISLMPNAIDAELSRGHPLFFHAIAAAWMHVFGSSHVSMHSFALLISVFFLVAIYEAGMKLFNQRVACMGLLLVAFQEAFFVQSSFVLLEVLVAFEVFLGLYFYATERYFLTALALFALFYTKESGLVLGFVLGIDAWIVLFNKNIIWKKRMVNFVSIAIPCCLALLYFVVQKCLRGWYIFPLHANSMEHSWHSFWYKFRIACVRANFYDNYKYLYFILLASLAVIAAIKNKRIIYLIVFLPGIIIYYFVDDMRAGRLLPPIPFFILFILSVLFFLFKFSRYFFQHSYQRRFIVLSGLFILCFLCFSTMNFFTYRYMLASLVPFLFLMAVFLDVLIRHTYKGFYYVVLVSVAAIGCCAFYFSDGYGDTEVGAFHAMAIQQNVVNFLEAGKDYDKSIACGSFLENRHLSDPATGFLHSDRVFGKVSWEIGRGTDLVVFDNLEPDARYGAMKTDSLYHLVYRTEKGGLWAEIYERKLH